MSSRGAVIDNRIVGLDFDGAGFEDGVKSSLSALDDLNSVLNAFDNKSIGTETLTESLEKSERKTWDLHAALNKIADGALYKIGMQAVEMGEQMLRAINPVSYYLDNARAGWDKYGQKIDAVQTIMSATSRQFDDEEEQFATVTSELEKLNWFTDETSYSYMDMVNNIGKFTSNGVDLKVAVEAMQGISTWAAISGANVNEAGRAMYNLSQAMGIGAVTLLDWKSIENANMGTVEFKETAIATAGVMGNLRQRADGTWETLKGVQVTAQNFRETLNEKWFTGDVLTTTLGIYGEFATTLHDVQKTLGYDSATPLLSSLKEYMDDRENFDFGKLSKELKVDVETLQTSFKELAADEYDLGRRAFMAAQEARTFTQVMDALKDALSTSFMSIFESIFGNLYEAKEFFSLMVEELYELLVSPVKAIEELMKAWHDAGGRLILLEGVLNLWESFKAILGAVGKAFADIFPSVDKDSLMEFTKRFQLFTEKLKPSEGLLTSITTAVKGLIYYIGGVGIKNIASFALSLTKLLTVKNVAMVFAAWLVTLEPVANLLSALGNVFSKLVSEVLSGTGIIKDFLYMLRYSEAGKAFAETIENIKKSISNTLTPALEWVTGWLNYFANYDFGGVELKKYVDAVSDYLMVIGGYASGVWTYLSTTISNIWKWLKELPERFRLFKEAVSSTEEFKTFIEMMKQFKEAVSENFSKAITFLTEQLKKFNVYVANIDWADVFTKVLNTIVVIAGVLYTIGSTIVNIATGIFNFFKTIGVSDFIKTIFNSVKDFLTNIPSFESFLGLLSNIGTAFSDVFNRAKEYLKNGEFSSIEMAKTWIKGIANGIKSGAGYVANIVGQFFSPVFGKIASIFSEISGKIVGFFPGLGEKIGAIKIAFPSSDIFSRLFEFLKNGFETVVTGVKKLINGDLKIDLKDSVFVKLFNGELFKDFANSKLVTSAKDIVGKIGDILSPIFTMIKNYFGSDAGTYAGKIAAAVLAFEGLKGLFNLIKDIVGLGTSVLTGLKGIADIPKRIEKLLESFTKINDAKAKLLSAEANKENADALLRVAVSIGVIAGALLLLTLIPEDKIIQAGVGLVAITVALEHIFKAINSGSSDDSADGFNKIGKGLKSIGTGLKIIGAGAVLMGMALAIGALVGALVVLKNIFSEGFDAKAMELAAGALLAMITALVVSMKLLNGVKIPISTALGMVAFGAALLLMTVPLTVLSNFAGPKLIESAEAIALMISLILAASKMADGSSLLALSVALIALAGSMVLLVPELLVIGNNTDTIGKGILVMSSLAGALGLISTVMGAFGKGKAEKSMLSLSVALIALAAAFVVLTPSLIALGQNLDSLKAFAGVMAILVAAGFVAGLGPCAAGLKAISMAMVAIGLAAVGIGIGAKLFADALDKIKDSVKDVSDNISGNTEKFSNALSSFVTGGVDTLAKVSPSIIPKIVDFLINTIVVAVEGLINFVGKIVNAATKFIGAIADQLARKGGAIWDAIDYLLLSVMDFVLEGIGRIIIGIGEQVAKYFPELGEKIKGVGEVVSGYLDEEVAEAKKHFDESQKALAIGEAILSQIEAGLNPESIKAVDIGSMVKFDWSNIVLGDENTQSTIEGQVAEFIKTALAPEQQGELNRFFMNDYGPNLLKKIGLGMEDLTGDAVSIVRDKSGNLVITGLNDAKDSPKLQAAANELGEYVVDEEALGITSSDGDLLIATDTAFQVLNGFNISEIPGLIEHLKGMGYDFTGYFGEGVKSEASQSQVKDDVKHGIETPSREAAKNAGINSAVDYIQAFAEYIRQNFNLDWEHAIGHPTKTGEFEPGTDYGTGDSIYTSGGPKYNMVKNLAADYDKVIGTALGEQFNSSNSEVKKAFGEKGFIGAVKSALGVASPSTEMKAIGEDVVAGFIIPFGTLNKIKMMGVVSLFFKGAVDAVNKLLESADGTPSQVFFRIGNNIVIGTINGIEDQTDELIDRLMQSFEESTDEVLKYLKMSRAGDSSELYNSIGQGILYGLMDGLEAQRPALMSLMQSIFGEMLEIGNDKLSEFYVLGYRLGEAIAGGAGSAGSLVHQAGANLFWEFYAGICEAAQINSPSKVMMEVGNYLGMGMAVGVEGSVNEVEEAARSMIDQTIEGVSKAITNINDAIYSGIDTTPVIRPVVDLTDVQNGLSGVNDAFGTASLQAAPMNYIPNTLAPSTRLVNAIASMTDKKEEKEPSIGDINITVNGGNGDPQEIAEAVRSMLISEIQRGRAVWA